MDKITHKVRCEQWTSIIKECLASGMPKTTWCREHGISDKSFFYWQRILREEAYLTTLENTLTPAVKENSAPTTTDFIEIKMTDQVSSADSPFKPDVVIRRGSVSIEISNTATEEEKTEDGMMFDTIHHIAIIGSDYEKSKHFYVDLLGLKVIRENYRKERDDYKIDLACGPQEIELFIIKNAPARVNYPEALGLRHLAFKVESVDDTVKELNGKGIETEPVRLDDYTGKKMTFFHDPDGLPLEIHE